MEPVLSQEKTITETPSEREALTHITAALTEIVSQKGEVTWMIQPHEQAVYVHVTDQSTFKLVVTHLEQVVHSINQDFASRDRLGSFICSADHERHCLDIYYSRY